MKTLYMSIILFTATCTLFGQNKISISEFENLNNTSWKGNLMYVNYGDGQEVNLTTTMKIKIIGNAIQMTTQFTDEPDANTKTKIKIKKDGSLFGNEEIVEKRMEDNGVIRIVTRFDGNDDNRPATIDKIYVIGDAHLSITKKVKFKDSNQSLIRNRYTYSKL